MAKATVGPRQTTRKVTLRLTEGEADLILALVSSTGGHLSGSPRKYATRVADALEEALGYDALSTDAYRHSIGHVHFRPYDTPDVTLAEHVDGFAAVAEVAYPEGLTAELAGVLGLILYADELVSAS